MTWNKLLTLTAFTGTLLAPGMSRAADAALPLQSSPRQATVVVIAEAVANEKSGCVGCPLQARSTGFFTSQYGTLVTSYHLLRNLGSYDPATLKVSIVYGDILSSAPRPAAIEFFDSARDILTLKTPEHPDGFRYLRYSDNAREQIQAGQTKVYTLGFPKGYPSHFTDSGIIKSFDGPPNLHFLWVTDMEFKDGQSGSPVYLEDGSVIGIVKGIEKDFPKNSFIVPINYVKRLTALEANLSPSVIRILARVKGKEVQQRELTRSFQETNNHCANNRDVKWQVQADEGWTIDTASVATKIDSITSNSSFIGITDLSSKGFSLSGVLRNNGECIRLFEQTIAKDGRGWLGVSATYKERKVSDSVQIVPIYKGTALPGIQILQQLPENTQEFTVFLEDNNGNVISQTGPGSTGQLRVQRDETLGTLQVGITQQ